MIAKRYYRVTVRQVKTYESPRHDRQCEYGFAP
ncbi:hypothetical protein PF70_04461 [Pseudomonas asplenii]|nr:hypothetical protein PF70_04461 [Pseudomonas fuscovaginae]